MKRHKMFWSSLSRHVLRTAGFIAAVLFMTAQTWGQTPMTMPMPAATATPTPMVVTKPTPNGTVKMPMPTPTPVGMVPSPTPKPDMKDMKQSGDTSKDDGMGDVMMGAAGLVPHELMVGKAGRWMVSYHFMIDRLSGKLDGTRRVSDASVLSHFEASPTDMTMNMHMFMVMYAPTNRLTLMAMLTYTKMSMGELHRDGTLSTESSQGIGDVELQANYVLYARKDLRHRFLLNVGVGLPTGSINAKDAEGARLEYPMQLGSGTFSVKPGFTYLGQAVPWGWGAEFIPTLRIGTNSIGYRLGNHYQPSVWGARRITPWLSETARLDGDILGNIKGKDPLLDPLSEPTKDTRLQGGRRLDLVFRTSLHPVKGALKGHAFFVDVVKPIYQSLDGPQLARRWAVRLGWHVEF